MYGNLIPIFNVSFSRKTQSLKPKQNGKITKPKRITRKYVRN